MKRLTILTLLFITFTGWVAAQSISGTVVDTSGTPKQGVAVVLENNLGKSVSVTSKSRSGAFNLSGIPIGQYVLKIFSGNTILGTSEVKMSDPQGVKDGGEIKAYHKLDVGNLVVK